jgi:hypothetical protein
MRSGVRHQVVAEDSVDSLVTGSHDSSSDGFLGDCSLALNLQKPRLRSQGGVA